VSSRVLWNSVCGAKRNNQIQDPLAGGAEEFLLPNRWKAETRRCCGGIVSLSCWNCARRATTSSVDGERAAPPVDPAAVDDFSASG
jgi:hypothetical protein